MLIDLENKCKRWINNAIADESLIEELKSIVTDTGKFALS